MSTLNNTIIPYENLSRTNKQFESEFKSAFDNFIEKDWYVLGQEVKSFEEEFASYVRKRCRI